MEASQYPKRNIEGSQDFFTDCEDLLVRFDRMVGSFFSLKSRRFKCFNDLRSAYECILKGAVAYGQPRDSDRKHLIRFVERYGHRISSLESAIPPDLACALLIEPKGDTLDQLPVDLRYTLDGFDFLEAQEQLYYATIGSDSWLEKLRSYIGRVGDSLGSELSRHSGVISVSDIPIEDILNPGFNKYRSEA
jgi:hypothetical protein